MLRYWASTTYFCQVVEAILTGLVLAIAFGFPGLGAQWFGRIEAILRSLAGWPRRTALLIIVSTVVVRIVLLPAMPIPAPSIHDEFSYLLGAKTFAAGRLTNLPDPFWRHFEGIHILQRPSYMSMYPPGQGLLLAAGLWATGRAWSGVVISAGLLGAALFWALSGWFTRPWALTIAILAIIRLVLFSYWMNSYWGGTLPAFGGALVFGSLPRLSRKPSLKNLLPLLSGIILLASTRPYEGLVLSSSSMLVLLLWSRKLGTIGQLCRPQVVSTGLGLLAIAGSWMLFYNFRVTRNPFDLPYLEDRKQYAVAPLFILGHPRPEPAYTTASLRSSYLAELDRYRAARHGLGIPEVIRKLKNFWIFFLGPFLSCPFVAFLLGGKVEQTRPLTLKRISVGIILLTMCAGCLQAVWFYPHYFAPALAPFLAMLLLGFQTLRAWRWQGRQTGLFLTRAIPVGCVVMAVIPASAYSFGWRLSYWPLQWALGSPAEVQGPQIRSSVLAEGKNALVFVDYGKEHDPAFEWIYNEPDIHLAKIIWARRVSPQSDAALMKRFRDRSIWDLRPDDHPWTLIRLRPPS